MLPRILIMLMTSFSHAFDMNPTDINRKCFTCSVFTFIDNRLLCANPGVCYANYCYSYQISDGRSMYLSGCAEDISDFPFRKSEVRTLCHTRGHFGICVCETGADACNHENTTELAWMDTDIVVLNAISHRVTGFSADYAKKRVQQLRVDGYPETFEGSPINVAPNSSWFLCLIFSFIMSYKLLGSS